MFSSYSQDANKGYVQKGSLAADFTILGFYNSHDCLGFTTSCQSKATDSDNFDNTDHQLLSVYIFICAFWQEDTQKILLVYIHRLIYLILF